MIYPAAAEIKPHRQGSKRALAIALLSGGGATLQAIMDETGWSRRDAREGVYRIHTDLGYGLAEDEHGVIRLLDNG